MKKVLNHSERLINEIDASGIDVVPHSASLHNVTECAN